MNQVDGETHLDGKAIRTKIILLSMCGGGVSALVMLLMLELMVGLTEDQKHFLILTGATVAPFATALIISIYYKLCKPFVEYVDYRERDTLDDEVRKRALRSTLHFPRQAVFMGCVSYPIFNLIIFSALGWAFDDLDFVLVGTLATCAVAVGMSCQMSMYIPFSTALEPVRALLAMEISDVHTRREAASLFPLPRKLAFSILPLIFMAVVLMVSLVQVRAKYGVAVYATNNYQRILNALQTTYKKTGDTDALLKEAEQTYGVPLGIEFELIEIDSEQLTDSIDLGQNELDWILQESSGGNSSEISSTHVFSWVALPETNKVLIAYTDREVLHNIIEASRNAIILFAVVIVGLTFFIVNLIARDMRRVFQVLHEQVRRIANGDLRRHGIVETDDELGELGRSIDEMSTSLRGTVGQVMKTVTRVDQAAEGISSIAQDVSRVTADQLQDSIQATEAVGNITLKANGITAAADQLTVSVKESTSAALEIKSVSEGLNDHTVVLSGKVADSEAAIEQMVPRIQEVTSTTEQLTSAVGEAMSSVEMLTQQIGQIETNALETARLSTTVTDAAERGRDRVDKTIEGMHAIANATETVQRVIEALCSRIDDIGHIVDVIDDVADETSLLALNASIISAQAGEHGRAFSIVSEEIKGLANRVTSNTKEIASLVHDLQTESANAIHVIGEGVSHVESGVALSVEAGATLQEITQSADASGKQVESIVSSVHEHRGSARRAVELMERVGLDAEAIKQANAEFAVGTDVVHSASAGVGELTQQVKTTTEEQERSTGYIAENMEGVELAVTGILESLQAQLDSCRQTELSLEKLRERTGTNEHATTSMIEAMEVLIEQSTALRTEVLKFKL